MKPSSLLVGIYVRCTEQNSGSVSYMVKSWKVEYYHNKASNKDVRKWDVQDERLLQENIHGYWKILAGKNIVSQYSFLLEFFNIRVYFLAVALQCFFGLWIAKKFTKIYLYQFSIKQSTAKLVRSGDFQKHFGRICSLCSLFSHR